MNERDIYIILITDRLKRIYDKLGTTPNIPAEDIPRLFEGNAKTYEKNKKKIFKQLGIKEESEIFELFNY